MKETGIESSEDMLLEDEDYMDEEFEIIGGESYSRLFKPGG